MVGKLYVSAFQTFFRIENPLNIKEVMSKNVCRINSVRINNAAMLPMAHVRDVRDVKISQEKIKGNTVQSNVTHVRDVKDISILHSL